MNLRPVLTITSKGQVTLRRSVLDHLGAGPGDRLVLEMLPDGRVEVKAASKGKIKSFFGCLSDYAGKPMTIEQMNDIIADGWAGKL